MGGVVKAVKGVFSGPEKVRPEIAKKNLFDISKEVKPAQQAYNPLLEASKQAQAAVAPQRLDVLKQMGLAATGQGPSLAEAQLKAAQDRNLAQQLAAVQAQRGGNSALQQRSLLQNMGAAGRDLAQQAAISRLQERDQFLNQAQLADQGLRTDIAGKLNLDLMPKQSLQGWEMQRVAARNQAQAQNAAAQNAMTGALIGGASSVLGGMATGGTGFFTKAATTPTPGAKDGGLITKDGVKRTKKDIASYMCGGKVKKYKDGGQVQNEDSVQRMKSFIENVRRSKYAGSGANATQAAMDQKKQKESPEEKARRSNEQAERIRNLKSGGEVDGPGTATSDSIPAMLSDGEFVVRAKVVQQPAILKFLEKLNNGKATEKDASALAKALAKKKVK